MSRNITAIALDVTTACNLRCPECCCSIGTRPAVHHGWSYFVRLAKVAYGIDRIDVTGGEPTCHPDFSLIAHGFRNLFNCTQLTLESNGFRLREHEYVLRNFDLIRLSQYGDNDDVIRWTVENFPSMVQNGSTCSEVLAEGDERGHIPRSRRGSGGPCNLGTCEFVAYSDGQFYPCRLGPGIPGAESMAPCDDWRARILDVPLPCVNCWFSP
jgi:hypothetical protein